MSCVFVRRTWGERRVEEAKQAFGSYAVARPVYTKEVNKFFFRVKTTKLKRSLDTRGALIRCE